MSEQIHGNQDEKEKSRPLSESERKRLDDFEALADRMTQEGYKRVDLTVSIVKANVFAIALFIPLFIIGFALFVACNDDFIWGGVSDFVWLLVAFAVLIVVHELIHGLTWSIFAEGGFKSISFGFMKKYLTPYCTCNVPLTKKHYILGALMPCLVVGIVPFVAGIVSGSLFLLLLGIIMIDAAAGDLLIVWKLLRYKTSASEVVYMDHPTQAGGVVFER